MIILILSTITLVVVLPLALLCLRFPDRGIGTHHRKDLKGPRGLPIIGNLLTGIRRGPRGLEWSFVSHQQYGPGFTGTIPGMRFIDISTRPDWLEHVQKTNFGNYVKGAKFYECNKDVLGKGIFNSDGVKIFTAASFRQLITPAIQKDLAALTTLLDHYAASGEPFDLQEVFFRFMLQSFGRIAFGTDMKNLSIDRPEVPFASAFDFAQKVLLDRILNPFWKVTERFSSTGAKMREAVQVISHYAFDIIDERERMLETGGKDAGGEKDLLALFMDVRDKNGEPLTRVQLRDAVVNLLIAGRDTTAQALAWTCFRLLRDPSLVEPILNEINTVVPGNTPVDPENVKSLHQIQALLNETLRLHPSIPKNLKLELSCHWLPGSALTRGDWLLGRQKDLWGDDALQFKPSRFLDEQTGELLRPGQWKGHWFSAGYRVCVGQNLALLEMASVLVQILKRYTLTFAPGYYESVPKATGIAVVDADEVPLYGPSLSLPQKYPLMVVASMRA
ncbi:hypothetical protein MNV49_002026 [Pseudohyphozyma bogoriensis]|nr:hypothetical protein MNV49_002026 [Pseudohyphozyma bogoriensis]